MTISSRDRWLGGAGLLLLGGLLMGAAAIVRWLPCLDSAQDALCVSRQSRTFDYIGPFAPHESLPAASVLAGDWAPAREPQGPSCPASGPPGLRPTS